MTSETLLLGSPTTSLPRRVEFTGNPTRVADRMAALPVARRGTGEAALVAISGIDGSGKGWLAERVARALEDRGIRTALIGVDPWQNPQTIRLSDARPGPHFYQHAIRWDALFRTLIEPLQRARSIELVTSVIDTDADRYRERRYAYENIDVILLEGIFLLKRELRGRYDQAWWVQCSFETALRRALARGQEGLPPEQTVADYERIYFPAQRFHFAVDSPVAAADGIFVNG